MSWAVLVQTNGLVSAFQFLTQARMSASRALPLVGVRIVHYAGPVRRDLRPLTKG